VARGDRRGDAQVGVAARGSMCRWQREVNGAFKICVETNIITCRSSILVSSLSRFVIVYVLLLRI
jgi:hypothetical protein